MQPPTPAKPIETDRLILQLPEPDAAAALRSFHAKNENYFAPYTPRRPDSFQGSVAEWRQLTIALAEACTAGSALYWLLRDKQQPAVIIGRIGFTAIHRGAMQAAFLGYQLDQDHVGRGLMTEALQAALQDAFGRMNLHRIMANYVPTNERSGRVLRRLGFVVEGYARDYLLLDGVWKDHILTSLSNPNWQAR